MIRVAAALIVAAAAVAAPAAAQELVSVNQPSLVNCSEKPCFKVTVSAVGADGKAIPLDPRPEAFNVTDDAGGQPRVFSAAAQGTANASRPKETYSMLLLDQSGSMLEPLGSSTRFEVARGAIRSVLKNLRDGVDHFALAPFASQNVVEGIRSARFENRPAVAIERLNGLAPPPRSNNTALFSAMLTAIPILKGYADRGHPVSLVVFTDGMNDVRPPPLGRDDPGLLGPEGLEVVRTRAAADNIEIRTIGFGARGHRMFDEDALKVLAWPQDNEHYHYAATGGDVGRILSRAQEVLTNQVELVFGPVADDKARLTGRTLRFQISTAATPPLRTPRMVWTAPQYSEPMYVARLSEAEARAYGSVAPLAQSNPWPARLTALGIFGALLSIGWFGVPRLIWPDRYTRAPDHPSSSSEAAAHVPENTSPGGQHRGPSDRGRGMPRGLSRPPGGSGPRPPRGLQSRPRSGEPETQKPEAARGLRHREDATPPDSGEATIYMPRPAKREKDS